MFKFSCDLSIFEVYAILKFKDELCGGWNFDVLRIRIELAMNEYRVVGKTDNSINGVVLQEYPLTL